MDGILHGRRAAAIALLASVALTITGVRLVGADGLEVQPTGATLATPPTVAVDAASMRTLDGAPDDGLTRVIVALEDPAEVVDGVGTSTVPHSPADSPAAARGPVVEDRDDARFARPEELSDADRALLAELGGGALQPPADGGEVAASPDPDDLRGLEGIEEVTPAGPGFAAVTTSLSATQLAALPGVASVEEDALRFLTADHYGSQWGHHNTAVPGADIRWEEARTRASGSGVVVAVIDSGVALDHPDLAAAWWTNPGEVCGNGRDDDANSYVDDCRGWDFANADATVDDAGADNSHGTHVAGIIAAADDRDGVVGVAPGARIMPLKIFHNGASSSSRLAAAITYAVDNGADVINLSLGGNQGTAAEETALRRASEAGIPVVVAAGNDGRDTDVFPTYPAAYDLPTLISIGSSDRDDRRSWFSNFGVTSVDVFAPGGEILSTVPGGLAYMSGTSMATPYAAGVAALVVQQGLTGASVRTVLMDTAKPVVDLEGRSVTGARIDAAAALGIPRGGGGVPEVRFHSFHDMVSRQADDAAVWVTARAEDLGVDDIVVRGTLGILKDTEVYGIVGEDVTVGRGTATTDAAGQFLLSDPTGLGPEGLQALGGGLELPFGWTVRSGEYAMAVEILDADDIEGGPLVPPALVFFRVVEGDPESADQVVEPDPVPAEGDPIDLPGTEGDVEAPVEAPVPGDTDEGTADTPAAPPGGDGTGGEVGGEVPGGTVIGAPLPEEPGTHPRPGDGAGGGQQPPGGGDGAGGGVGGGGGGVGGGVGGGQEGNPGNGGDHGGPGVGTDVPVPGVEDPGTDVPDPDVPVDGAPEGDGGGGAGGILDEIVDAIDGVVDGVVDDVVDGGEEVVDGVTGGTPEDGDEGTPIEGTVSPDRGGPTTTAVTVTIPAGIPDGAFITFDTSNAPITARLSPTRVMVSPPPHSPGVVDVGLVTDGRRQYIPSAYTYLDAEGTVPAPDGDAPGTDPAPGDAPVVDAPPPGGEVTAPDPGTGTGTPPGADTGGGGEQPDEGSGDTGGDSPATPTPPVAGGPFPFNGLMVDVLPADSPLAGLGYERLRQEACLQEVCAARSR